MATYRWDGNQYVDKATGEPMTFRDPNAICCPMVISDTPEYISPVTGRIVHGRRERREDLKRAGCVEWEPDSKSKAPKGIANPRIAKKYGLPVSEEAQHRKRAQRIDPLKDI